MNKWQCVNNVYSHPSHPNVTIKSAQDGNLYVGKYYVSCDDKNLAANLANRHNLNIIDDLSHLMREVEFGDFDILESDLE